MGFRSANVGASLRESEVRGKVKGAVAVRRWFALAEDALETHRERLNRLNVYPVPDSDTGSNMLATIRASRAALERTDQDDLGALLGAAGAQAMGSAHGNSGTLLAVLISGFAEPLHGEHRLTVKALSRGLDRASLRGWSALSQPVTGTMLSVLDAARDQARSCAAAAPEPDSRAAVEAALPKVVHAAREAVAQTEQQLPELTRAQVVDAGGLGLLLVLDALSATVRAEQVDHHLMQGLSGWGASPDQKTSAGPPGRGPGAGNEAAPPMSGVELMCTVQLSPLQAAGLRHRLDELGDSVIITPIGSETVSDGRLRWRIHIHTMDSEETLRTVQEAGPLESSSTSLLSR
ncbi:DAK2 domain-containing protein [Nesterenkonia natronophila]|uniref:DAK2 domain-containing protein n=1 Tax=Nesterenkonia natronophila TaxID=2174932 RepID=A0A3A4F0H4_9MICC|nr:DAK2 domain-containing protein [Nesterenkonia natronophila]RJN31386.1 DAK2 domain-containing protein [Nesterenkonia natronophila]